MRTVGAKRAYPMHMWNDFSIIDKLIGDPCSLPYRDRIAPRGMYERRLRL